MFDQYGRPDGYGQYSPYRQTPNPTQPGQPGRPPNQPTPLQTAILGQPPQPSLNIPRNTGVVGPTQQPNPAGSTPPQGPQPPSHIYNVLGAEADKINNADYHSRKYDLLRTIRQFDPAQGITPEVVNALKAQGYNVLSASGDKLTYQGLDGRPVQLDLVKGSHSNHPEWNYLLQGERATHTPLQSAILGVPTATPGMAQASGTDALSQRIAQILQALQTQNGK